jgi:hypothetical protein
MTVEEALRVVEERLDAVLLAGLERLDIIHGRGTMVTIRGPRIAPATMLRG